MRVKQRQEGVEPMTIIIGIICKDGLVLACDSQASSMKGVPLKRTEYTKIYEIPMGADNYALLSGAGTGAFVTRASELLTDKCKNHVCQTPRDFADICEDVVTDIFKRYVIDRSKALGMSRQKMPKELDSSIQWQEGENEPPIIIISGIQCGNGKSPEWCLYTIHPDGVAEKSDRYDAIGSGSAIAEYLLARLCSKPLNVEQAVVVGVYVVEEVKKIDPFCGGATQVVSLSKSGSKRLSSREVKRIADYVMEQDDALAAFWLDLIIREPDKPKTQKKRTKSASS
jgi:20S proteasome alpha/beta subunit